MAKKKQKNKGVVIRDFGFKGVQYKTGATFETNDRKAYDNLINIKRIK